MLSTPAEPMVPGDLNYSHISRSLLCGWEAILTHFILFYFLLWLKDDGSAHTDMTSIPKHQMKAQLGDLKKKPQFYSSDQYKISFLKTHRISIQMACALKQKRNIVVQVAEHWETEFWVPVLTLPSISMYYINLWVSGFSSIE